ncbi:MAG: hypothetical protein GY769_13610 [bacterium]|nr:hypothetical protein [bacterium]
MKRRGSLLAVLLMTVSLSQRATSAAGPTWEAWYSVSARVRGVRADADLEAGGRLSMAGLETPSGALSLSLGGVLEHPWKLYWVDPLGPFGEEVKTASVVTLPEASWTALETARAANRAHGRREHQRWLEHAQRPRALDGSFAFIVIGRSQDRFRFEVGADGAVSEITNRMTHSWLPGPFDQFIGKAEPVPIGYWFWNQGETEPFDYEPHTYDAFATALELLAVPLPRAAGATLSWPDAADIASKVLGTLAPKGRSRLPAAAHQTSLEALVRAETLPNGNQRLIARSSTAVPALHIERETVFSSDGRPVSSRARVRLESGRSGMLEVEVGYKPEESE